MKKISRDAKYVVTSFRRRLLKCPTLDLKELTRSRYSLNKLKTTSRIASMSPSTFAISAINIYVITITYGPYRQN